MAKISLIDRNELIERITAESDGIITDNAYDVGIHNGLELAKAMILNVPTIDAQPVVHGRWMLEVHKEISNYRWNVTAECSECCDEVKEIWDGIFPNVPDCIAKDVSLMSAKSVKLSNYCPNCGAKMDGGNDDGV